MAVETKIETITVARAKRDLETKADNRGIKEPWVAQLAGRIERGEWQLNGESIVYSTEDRLLDGQHRLCGVVKAGKPIRSVVITGVDPEAFHTIDTGKTRSLADLLKIDNEVQTAALAGTLNWLWVYEVLGEFRHDGRYTASPEQAFGLLRDKPGIRESVKRTGRIRRRVGIGHSLAAALHYVLAGIDPSDAEFFYDQLYVGAGMATTDPIHVLREKLVSNSMQVGSRRLTATEMAAFLIKAWNSYRRGDRVQTLRWNPGGSRPDAFPEPV